MEGILLQDGQEVKGIDDSGYKYTGILETDQLKEEETKDLFSKEYKRRLKIVPKKKLSGKKKIMAVNTWSVQIPRYSAGMVEQRRDELKELDRKTRKMMTVHGALNPTSDVDLVYLPRQKRGRGLIGCEMCVKTEKITWHGMLGFRRRD